jgi:curved DNA-binding protein CbpA
MSLNDARCVLGVDSAAGPDEIRRAYKAACFRFHPDRNRDAPEEVLPIPEIEMGFESEAPTKETLRQLIWEEVLRYHPHLARPLPGSRTT